MIRKHDIQIVLHDWNGCLLNDTPHRHEHGVCAIFRHYGLPEPSIEDYSHNITSSWIDYYYERGIPHGDSMQDDMVRLTKIMLDNLADAPFPPLFDDAKPMLEKLADARVTQVLVSSLAKSEFWRQFHFHKLSTFFTEVHADIRKKTPVFSEILQRQNVDPRNAIGVTDSISDVKALNNAGVEAIIVPRGYCNPDPLQSSNMKIMKTLNDAVQYIL